MRSLRRLPGWARALAALAVAGLVALPLGGWDTVERGGAVQALEPGQVHVADRFATRVDGAEVVTVRPGSSLDPEPGVAYLVVRAQVENRTDASDDLPPDLLVVTADGRELDSIGSVQLVSDGTSAPELQPGLPADLLVVHEIEEGAVEAGDTLTVSVVDRTATESLVSSGTVWLFPRVGAVVDLEVA